MGELVDKIKGNVNEALGKAKQQSDDPVTQAKGADQEATGRCRWPGRTCRWWRWWGSCC